MRIFTVAKNSEKINDNLIDVVSSNSSYATVGGVVLVGLGLALWAYKTDFFHMRKTPKIDDQPKIDTISELRSRIDPQGETPSYKILLEKYTAKSRILRRLERIENSNNPRMNITEKCLCYDRIKELEQGLGHNSLVALEIMEKLMK